MGNKPCRIALQVDDPHCCRAGETMTGKVYLCVTKKNRKSQSSFRGIHLLLTGSEEVELPRRRRVVLQDANGNRASRRRSSITTVERTTHTVVRIDHSLASLDYRNLRPGHYEYPFEWCLPANLPGSLLCTKKANCFAKLSYTLTAYIRKGDGEDSYYNPGASSSSGCSGPGDHHSSCTIRVMAQSSPVPSSPSTRNPPIVMDPEEFPVATCCFWKKGYISLGWQTESNVSYPGARLAVVVTGDNQSKTVVRKVMVQFIETVTFQTTSAAENTNTTSRNGKGTVQQIRNVLAKQSVPLLNRPQWQPQATSTNRRVDANTADLLGHLPTTVIVAVPPTTRDTYYGSFIQVEHTLVVSLETGALSTDPKMSSRIRIAQPLPASVVGNNQDAEMPAQAVPNHRTDESTVVIQGEVLPPDWQPVAADVTVLPEATAVLLNDDNEDVAGTRTTASVATNAWDYGDDDNHNDNTIYVPSPTAPLETSLRSSSSLAEQPTVEQLNYVVTNNPEDLDAVLNDTSSWSSVVKNLTPGQFCFIVHRAGPYGPSVARTLAVLMGSAMTSRHLLACLYSTIMDQDNSLRQQQHCRRRIEVLEQIAPLVSDVASCQAQVEEELEPDDIVRFRSALKQ